MDQVRFVQNQNWNILSLVTLFRVGAKIKSKFVPDKSYLKNWSQSGSVTIFQIFKNKNILILFSFSTYFFGTYRTEAIVLIFFNRENVKTVSLFVYLFYGQSCSFNFLKIFGSPRAVYVFIQHAYKRETSIVKYVVRVNWFEWWPLRDLLTAAIYHPRRRGEWRHHTAARLSSGRWLHTLLFYYMFIVFIMHFGK